MTVIEKQFVTVAGHRLAFVEAGLAYAPTP